MRHGFLAANGGTDHFIRRDCGHTAPLFCGLSGLRVIERAPATGYCITIGYARCRAGCDGYARPHQHAHPNAQRHQHADHFLIADTVSVRGAAPDSADGFHPTDGYTRGR